MATIAKSVASVVDKTTAQVLWFREVGIGDVGLVGGKNASLGEMIQHLSADGIRVPNGFATTAFAYRRFLQASGLDVKLQKIFAGLDPGNLEDLRERGKQVRGLILAATFPQDLEELIAQGYAALCREYGPDTDVAVRSSATAEDLPDASFAGQQETYLNVHGISRRSRSLQDDRLLRCSPIERSITVIEQGLRSFEDRALGRRAADGPLGSGGFGGDVHARHRDRIPRCSADQRRIRTGRKHRAGLGQSR